MSQFHEFGLRPNLCRGATRPSGKLESESRLLSGGLKINLELRYQHVSLTRSYAYIIIIMIRTSDVVSLRVIGRTKPAINDGQ